MSKWSSYTYNGYQKCFCIRHFTEHRKELDGRMSEVVQEFNQLHEVLKPQDIVHFLLSRIEELHRMLERPPNIEIVEHDSKSSFIRMIKVMEKSNSGTDSTINQTQAQSRSSIESKLSGI
ncbi:unnamed protein product [Rotaria magnacalcarata]|uniref:Uncharacterized protein n=2 Tax=Rotaria magnacalcarata TaxID=392030 RepID=A0A816M7S2_9BILA|nr:unnamed protein product [Rotaria magnacalcarata]